jgi:hypothetical protein
MESGKAGDDEADDSGEIEFKTSAPERLSAGYGGGLPV